jgi:hypothetical protein
MVGLARVNLMDRRGLGLSRAHGEEGYDHDRRQHERQYETRQAQHRVPEHSLTVSHPPAAPCAPSITFPRKRVMLPTAPNASMFAVPSGLEPLPLRSASAKPRPRFSARKSLGRPAAATPSDCLQSEGLAVTLRRNK